MKKNKNSLLVLCVTKNSGNQLQKTLERFSKIQNHFSRFKILVYENNSSDNTKEVLKEAKLRYSFLDYFAFDYTQEEIDSIAPIKHKPRMIPCGVQMIAHGRNFLLEKAKDVSSDYEYTLVFDPDVFYFNPRQIVKAVKTFQKLGAHVLSVNGLTKALKYRDAYAFRSKNFLYGPEYLGQTWWKEIVHHIQKRFIINKKIPVYSAFGGAAIYNTKEYIKGQYSALHTDISLMVQKEIIECNPNSLRLDSAPLDSPIENTNYTGAVVCEHVPFHYSLYNEGFTKQYIDTSWKILFLK